MTTQNHVIIRGWKRGVLRFTEHVKNSDISAELVQRHVAMLLEDGECTPHMVELEFLDEPDPLQRFFRFGSDPRAMVKPVPLGLLNWGDEET